MLNVVCSPRNRNAGLHPRALYVGAILLRHLSREIAGSGHNEVIIAASSVNTMTIMVFRWTLVGGFHHHTSMTLNVTSLAAGSKRSTYSSPQIRDFMAAL